jgi:hypothetical protein
MYSHILTAVGALADKRPVLPSQFQGFSNRDEFSVFAV